MLSKTPEALKIYVKDPTVYVLPPTFAIYIHFYCRVDGATPDTPSAPQSSSKGDFHPNALPEPYVNLSIHTALIIHHTCMVCCFPYAPPVFTVDLFIS